ncbi:hypothetical protein MMC19_007714 [Ptychographa xylographoides]|nr:hypothetical protein [Ptychographa xylographoides]
MFSSRALDTAWIDDPFRYQKPNHFIELGSPDREGVLAASLEAQSFVESLPLSPASGVALFQSTAVCVDVPPPPPLTQHPAFRKSKPKHVPILITQGVIEAVLRNLPDSPQSPGCLDRQLAPSILLRELQRQTHIGDQTPTKRPRHIPIIIPEFAQPYGPFPPSPSESECSTPRPSKPAPSGPSTISMAISHPAANVSRTSTLDSSVSEPSPSQMYAGRFQPSSSTYLTDMNSSKSSLNDTSQEAISQTELPLQASFRSVEATPFSAGPASAGGAQQLQATPGTTNLSGLTCNVHRCTGKEPHALVGATTTILGDKLYVFGGRRLSRRRPQLTADLYELDLIRRHWTKLETSGDVPPPRYFHSVCALGDNKLVCYGGMSPASVLSPKQPSLAEAQKSPPIDQQPEVVVMSDIHVYDANTRTWTFISTRDNPQGRYAHCATVLPTTTVFTSANAPLSAIHHNPSSGDPNQGSIGVALDGTGGAEMVVVGGQDSANHYIEQISVFNLRSLKWTATHSLGRSCGAYRSVVAPLLGISVSKIGQGAEPTGDTENIRKSQDRSDNGSSMLIYSNYNFLDVKLELQIRLPDGSLTEKPMQGQFSPPGLRFPNGGVLDRHFVVSGTYLTSSKQEYALWALDLRSLTWSRIDAGGSVFSQGSWNRGVLWPRRNTFVILGSRKRSLVEDYNHRRINFSNICLVELEAFGLYDNPRHATPTSTYSSYSAPTIPTSLRPKTSTWTAGGRPHFAGAEALGQMAMGLRELCDMDIVSVSGERIPINSHVLARRWGPYFVHLLREGANSTPTTSNLGENSNSISDAATLRAPNTVPSRNSSITITPSINTIYSTTSTLISPQSTTTTSTLFPGSRIPTNTVSSDTAPPFHPPNSTSLPPSTRPRALFLPHTPLTIHALLHYLYTSALPPPSHSLCTPQILCSLLQLARPYHVDGLLEAVVERLHQVMDGRNAAAVFNASAMAAGGGRGTGFDRFGNLNLNNGDESEANADSDTSANGASGDEFITQPPRDGTRGPLRIETAFPNGRQRHVPAVDESEDEGSSYGGSASQASSVTDGSEYLGAHGADGGVGEEVWGAEISCVVGLQKRGLRGLVEGRRMRERGRSVGVAGDGEGRVGLGLGLA